MKSISKSIAILFCSILLFTGCDKDPQNDGELSYTIKSINLAASLGATGSASGSAVAALSNGSITWTSGTVNVQKIEFSGKRAQSDFSAEYGNLTSNDILSTGTIAGSVTLPAGTYNDIELKLKLVQSSTKTPLTLKGTYTEVSGTKIPVEIQFNEAYEFKLNPSQIIIKGDKYKADITFELNNLVKNLTATDFGQTTRTAPNNTILVTNAVNVALYTKLKANLSLIPKVQVTHQ